MTATKTTTTIEPSVSTGAAETTTTIALALLGIVLPPDVIGEIHPDHIRIDQQSAEFYADYEEVAELKKGTRIVCVVPSGDVSVSFPGEDQSYKNERASQELRDRNHTDQSIAILNEEEYFRNCNWFDIYVKDEGRAGNRYFTTESVISEIGEALRAALELLEESEETWADNFPD